MRVFVVGIVRRGLGAGEWQDKGCITQSHSRSQQKAALYVLCLMVFFEGVEVFAGHVGGIVQIESEPSVGSGGLHGLLAKDDVGTIHWFSILGTDNLAIDGNFVQPVYRDGVLAIGNPLGEIDGIGMYFAVLGGVVYLHAKMLCLAEQAFGNGQNEFVALQVADHQRIDGCPFERLDW